MHVPVILGGFTVYLNLCYYSVGFTPEFSKFFVFAGIGLVSTLMGYSVAQTLSSAMATPRVSLALLLFFCRRFVSLSNEVTTSKHVRLATLRRFDVIRSFMFFWLEEFVGAELP